MRQNEFITYKMVPEVGATVEGFAAVVTLKAPPGTWLWGVWCGVCSAAVFLQGLQGG